MSEVNTDNVTKIDAGLQYRVFRDYAVFDEKGSTYATLRKAQWIKSGGEEDESKAKLEIRKMYYAKGEERWGKGYTFATEDGPHELAEILVENEFGDTKKILKSLVKRKDFKDTVKNFNSDEDADTDNGDLFDMRDLLNFNNVEEA